MAHHDADTSQAAVPDDVTTIAANNPHLHYIVENIALLATVLRSRPWGLGFSDMCLLTSDVPVVVFNRQDAADQIPAVALSDVMLPLDPHRLLLLPSPRRQATDIRKRTDHRLHLPGAVGMAFVQVAYDVADRLLIHHPRHDPWTRWQPRGPRQPAPWDGDDHPAPQFAMDYTVLPPSDNIERRWTNEHPPPAPSPSEGPTQPTS